MILCAGTAAGGNPGAFGIRAGIGYDYVSQEYFLDSLRLLGEDSLVGATLLKRDYLDDKKVILYLTWDNRSLISASKVYGVEIGWEQTDEIYRAVSNINFGLSGEEHRLSGEIGFDTKKRFSGAVNPGEEVTVLDGYLKYRYNLSDRTEAGFKIYGERVWFDSATSYVYDYGRLGATLRMGLLSENYNSITLDFTGELREVPDSADLNYKLFRGSLGYIGTLLGSFSSGSASLEYRDYKLNGGLDDYFLSTLYATSDWSLSENYVLETNISLELFDYAVNDFVNADYFLGRFDLLMKRKLGDLNLVFGPKSELYFVETDYSSDDDYYEISASLGTDYIGSKGNLLLLENQLGQRDYNTAQIYTSDFWFNRLTVVGSAGLWRDLTLDIFFSAEWEWHEIGSDDNRIFLVTTDLTYRF
jgi:hypothetical protein